MNHFELFKLKAAGLTNLNILNILDYQETQDRKLSLRDMAVVSKSKNAVLYYGEIQEFGCQATERAV